MASQSLVEEASKEGALHSPSADDQEAPPPQPPLSPAAEESTPGGDQVTPKKRGRKRRMEEEEEQEEGERKRKASPLDRPSRDRKSVDRYAALSPIRSSATKVMAIQQGSGEKLKDIPNVAFKLSKRKADESLGVLHRILFGRKANVHFLKRNILQFSGFVWSPNEEKDKLKVKEKLNKCNKDRLLDLSDLLDIYTLKGNTKKEDISAKLMEFLESPHVTREVILSEKVKKGKKRKRGVKRTGKRTSDEALSDKSEKRQHRKPAKDNIKDKAELDSIDKDDESADEDKSSDAEETDENSKSETEGEEDEQKPEFAKKSSEEGTDELEKLESNQHSPAATKVSPAKSKKAPSSSKRKVDKESETNVSSNMSKTSKKSLSSSKKKVDTEGEFNDINGSLKRKNEKITIKTDLNGNSKRKSSTKGDISEKADKKKGKGNVVTASIDMKGSKKEGAKMESNSEEKQGKQKEVSDAPSTEQLSAVLSKILKEVDFNVATLSDIIRKLGTHFDTDLMDRKAEIKSILKEVINSMTDDEDAEDGDEEGEKN